MNNRERARRVLRRIHESNVRLSFGPGMHVMTPDNFVFDAVLEALDESEARMAALMQLAEAIADGEGDPQEMARQTLDMLNQGDNAQT